MQNFPGGPSSICRGLQNPIIRTSCATGSINCSGDGGFVSRMLRSAPPLSVVILLDVFLFAFDGSILLLKLFGSDHRYAEPAAGADHHEGHEHGPLDPR